MYFVLLLFRCDGVDADTFGTEDAAARTDAHLVLLVATILAPLQERSPTLDRNIIDVAWSYVEGYYWLSPTSNQAMP